MGFDYTSFLDESTNELCVVSIDCWGCYLKSLVQMVSDVVSNFYCNLLILRLILNLGSKGAVLISIINYIKMCILFRRSALTVLEAPKSA